ncbi:MULTISPECIES: asparagine synthase (glutamine-hydrolyzing) [unclassified Nocardioides]|uniref:asparagine synthase (glutamine-hydrolyzing) n=1 Tax=unclassified Nocardioides TaxID=2615069 RepID=UPI003620B9FB
MCGIAGIHRFDGDHVDPRSLDAMAAVLTHRGPDESATWIGGHVGLAHTRLSIIDLAHSHQPMISTDGRWALVFNGEIFNYRELRAGLSYPFRTDGDTEVLLAGLVVKGIDFVTELRGQFAFAAHDRLTGVTHLVRDRLGVLPLHYRLDGESLVFASEVKAILAVADRPPAVDPAALESYLARRVAPAPQTLFEGIRKLLPGHRAEVSADGRLTLTRYWSIPPVDRDRSWTPTEAVQALDDTVRDAVRAALVADVPVGCYLSGGVDSSLIAAVVKSIQQGGSVHTFAAGFGDERNDELPWARLVSEHVGTTHHEVQVRATDFEELWPMLTWHRDAPVSQPADVAMFRLAQLAREQVRVVLSGEGGDELFAGYPKHRVTQLVQHVDLVPPRLRRALVSSVEPRLGTRAARLRIALRAAGAASERERLEMWFAPFTPEERRTLLGGASSPQGPLAPLEGDDAVDRMLRHDLASWLPDNLLERGDRMSMAASLELRPPLLDHRVVELAFRMPSSVKIRGGTSKWALKEVARRYLPETVVDRRKVGFQVPLDAWFRAGLRDSMWDRLTGTDSFVGQTLDRKAVTALLDRHDSGRFNEESRIWTLMCLEVWHERFFRTPLTARSHR